MITRSEIRELYLTKNNIIKDPGKYQGEPEYAVYFYEAWLEGEGMDLVMDGQVMSEFTVDEHDASEFPELKVGQRVVLWQDSNGFVHTRIKK